MPLKKNVDDALKDNEQIERVIVFRRANNEIHIKEGRDAWWHRELEYVDANCAPEPMDSEDPLFILYTSGSTGKPKGILHTTGGYLLGAALTTKYVFDLKPEDVYWCTADIGWVTGHTYTVYGPLCNACDGFDVRRRSELAGAGSFLGVNREVSGYTCSILRRRRFGPSFAGATNIPIDMI